MSSGAPSHISMPKMGHLIQVPFRLLLSSSHARSQAAGALGDGQGVIHMGDQSSGERVDRWAAGDDERSPWTLQVRCWLWVTSANWLSWLELEHHSFPSFSRVHSWPARVRPPCAARSLGRLASRTSSAAKSDCCVGCLGRTGCHCCAGCCRACYAGQGCAHPWPHSCLLVHWWLWPSRGRSRSPVLRVPLSGSHGLSVLVLLTVNGGSCWSRSNTPR